MLSELENCKEEKFEIDVDLLESRDAAISDRRLNGRDGEKRIHCPLFHGRDRNLFVEVRAAKRYPQRRPPTRDIPIFS